MTGGIFAGYTVRPSDTNVRQGMTLAERQAERERLHDEAMTRIKRVSFTAMCETEAHDLCRGEEPGCCGCLCECHDAAAKAASSEASQEGSS
jgi:hypothetical protein